VAQKGAVKGLWTLPSASHPWHLISMMNSLTDSAPSMERVASLPAAPHTLLEHDKGSLVLGFAEGLGVYADGGFRMASDWSTDWVMDGALDAVARGPDGVFYGTNGSTVQSVDVDGGGKAQDVTAAFSGRPCGRSSGKSSGHQQIICTPDGELWVEGCGAFRRPGGTFASVPSRPVPGSSPVPLASDIYGNRWSLIGADDQRQVLVLSANMANAWQQTFLPAGKWKFLVADSVGFVWVGGQQVGGEQGWRVFCPRNSEAGWQTVVAGLPSGQVTATGHSPNELVMAAYDTGEIVELDTDKLGNLLVRPLATLEDTPRCVLTDRHGAIWATTEDGLFRQAPAADAWQRIWDRQRGRLPGGGNHDVFAASSRGRLYIAGGWAGEWGLPPTAHVCDELLVFDPRSQYWEVASRMHMPKRYNGIAALDEKIWVIGGETRTAGREGEGQALYLVDIYDPASDSWRAGPALNDIRTDPFVVTCNDRIYAIGGASHNSGPKLDTVESIGVGETAWRAESPLPEPTRQGHACVLDGVIYCASIDGMYAFDTANGTWDENLPQPGDIGQGPLAAAYQGEVWLIGGFGDQRCRCYNPKTRSWRTGPDLPTEQAWGAAIVLDEQLYVIAGAHGSEPHDAVVFDDRTYALRQENHES
jgi:hypothetical protein